MREKHCIVQLEHDEHTWITLTLRKKIDSTKQVLQREEVFCPGVSEDDE